MTVRETPLPGRASSCAAFPVEEFKAGVTQRVTEGLVVIGAAADKAYEFADLKHGLLTYAILQAFSTSAADENKNGRLSLRTAQPCRRGCCQARQGEKRPAGADSKMMKPRYG